MQRVALYGTLVVVLNAVANLLHTISHVGQQLMVLPAWQLAYAIVVVVYFAPAVAVPEAESR
jgi:hypothetical protein